MLLSTHVQNLTPVVRVEWPISMRWHCNWHVDPNDVGRMLRWMALAQPRCVLETGTFEGLGTALLAQGMTAYGGGELHTCDWAGDAENRSVTPAQWAELAELRRQNIETVRGWRPAVRLHYHDGDTRQTIPTIPFSAPIDFWFQDTMHFLSGILEELTLVEPLLAPGAVIVFDDINSTHPLRTWMAENRNDGWFHHHFEGGHSQLWSQKLQ